MLVLIIAGLVGLTWGNLRFAQENPGGNDFLPRWLGTRIFLLEGTSPYSSEVAERIQIQAYGHPAQEGEDEMRFAYPLYSILLFIPFSLINDFTLARSLWMTLLEVSLILICFLSIRAARWRPGLIMYVVMILFSVTWYHGLRALINGNAVVLVGLGLIAAYYFVRNRDDEMAGVVLAICTIKPQVAFIPGLFLLFWTISQHRWKMTLWFFGSLGLLCGATALLQPDWMQQNIQDVLSYSGYTEPGTPGQALSQWLPGIGQRLGIGLSILVGIVLLVEWFLASRRKEKGLFWTFCITLVIGQWSGIQNDPGNYVLLFPAIPLIFSTWESRWKRGGRIVTLLTIITILVGIWAVFLLTVEHGDQPIQSPIMIFVLPVILIILLYSVRWWVIHNPKTWSDLISEGEKSGIS